MFKFNGGSGAIVCDSCRTIIKTGITPDKYNKGKTGVDLCDTCRSDNIAVVDNFDQIESLMNFSNQNEFYFVQIIQRRKDGNVAQMSSNGYRTIKTYYIYSIEQLEAKKEKIKELCVHNNARAYIHVNKRNATEVALHCIREYAKLVSQDNAYQGYRVYDSACGFCKARGYKATWIIDVDTKDPDVLQEYINAINQCRGNEDNKIKHIVPTLHGYHLLTSGFDLQQFRQISNSLNLPSVDVQKDNPTLLYYLVPKINE